jgi:hypothetical protein
MLSIDIFRPSAHLEWYPPPPAEDESDRITPIPTRTRTRTRTPLLPPYSAQPREGEQTVRCDHISPNRRVVRLHRRRCLAWLPGLGRLQSPQPHDQDDVERGELAVVYPDPSETDESPGKLVVSGWQLVLALLFALMVGIAISKPI